MVDAGDQEGKRLFLREGIDIKDEETEVYNLNKEFAASRKNKSIPLYSAIITFTLLLTGATVWLTYGIQRDIDRVSVGIEDFKDINMQELLKSLRSAQQELDKMEDTISSAKHQMGLEIEKIRTMTALEIKKIEESGIGQAEKRRLIQSIRAENERKIAESRKISDQRTIEKEKEVEAARLKLESYKNQVSVKEADYDREMNRKMAEFRKDADARILKFERIDEERKKAYETKMEEQKREYQALLKKYEQELSAARENYRKDAAARMMKSEKIDEERKKASETKMEEQKREYLTLLKKQEEKMNSLQDEKRSDAEKRADTENLLLLYRQALTHYAKSRGEHGYVIDPGKNGIMLVDINPFINLKNGDQAYVLDSENRVAALVELQSSGSRVRAKIVKRVSDGAIRPFDKILLKKN